MLSIVGGSLALGATAWGRSPGAHGLASRAGSGGEELFGISLAQWSLHRSLRNGDMTNLDFAAFAKRECGIEGVEYVNSFFFDKATDFGYLREMKTRAEDVGVKSLLIMCDGEGALADADDKRRAQAIFNHYKWVVAAAYLGCHSIRVNAAGSGSYEDTQARAADSLVELATFAAQYGLNVIVENHGGLSSNGEWLSGVMRRADNEHVGTLPDFGNFHLQGDEWYDRYKGVSELMPFAKAVSAKSYEFDEDGNELRTDYRRMLEIVLAAGYRGYLGVEYEGDKHSELAGILLTRDLLLRVRAEHAAR